MNTKKLLIILFLCSLPFISKATIGCLSDNTVYTYINPMNATYNGWPAYYHRYESDRRLTESNFCTKTRYPIRSCYIYATRDGYASSPGTLVNYYTNVRDCQVPIDASLWYLILPVLSLGYLTVKRGMLSGVEI